MLLVDHPLVGRWWEARQRREAYAADVVGHYPRAVDAERGTLAGLLGDESLRHSMTLVAPEAAAYADGTGRPSPPPSPFPPGCASPSAGWSSTSPGP